MKYRYRQIPFVTPLEPDITCYLRGNIYPRDSHEMLSSWTLQQTRTLRKLIIVFCYIGLLTCPTSAFPSKKMEQDTTVREHRDKIYVQATGCRSLSLEELRTRMGAAFDDTKMAYDDDSVKRSMAKSVIDDGDGDDINGYLNDEEDIEHITDLSVQGSTVSVQSRKFMRRKREVMFTSNSDNTNLESDNSFLYQNLLSDSLKHTKSRKRRSSGSQFHPAWECKKKKRWLRMKDGYFPSKILDGKCKQDTCFFGMYTCNPVKYAIKVLKRDPVDACKPVPLIGLNTTYEEAWVFKRIHVTVACECGQSWKAAKRKQTRDDETDE